MAFSPKQVSYLVHSDAFLNIADGAIRSGKTHIALRRFGEYCGRGPAGDMGVFGKTERTIRRNVVYPMMDMYEKGVVKHVQGSGELYVFGRRCHVIGANDARSQEKVTGLTLSGGYMNEVSLYPSGLFNEAIGRSLSVAGARWFGDTNPDSPFHWLYTDFLTAGHPREYLKRWRFTLDDNPILPAENVAMLKALYVPGSLFYRRKIEGEWVQAEGAVYQQWDEDAHVVEKMPAPPSRVVIGVDKGTQNATVYLALGRVGETWYVFAEYYHSGRESGRQKTNGEYADDFVSWFGSLNVAPYAVEVDPSAADFKLELKKRGVRYVHDADNAVLDGIEMVSTALTAGTLKVLRRCERLRKEMPSYVWDEKAQQRGVDAPVKLNDDAADALRYGVAKAMRRTAALRVVR